jgi:hypothetical protein
MSSDTRRRYGFGIELGNPVDGSTIAIVERCNPPSFSGSRECPANQAEFQVRHLQRFPTGTLYTKMRDEITNKLWTPELNRENALVQIAVDQTVVAPRIVDLVLAQAQSRSIRRLLLTNDHTESETNGLISVPKLHITGNIQALLETGSLKIAEALKETPELAKELINYRGRQTTLAPADAWRTEPGDDLVFAVGIACWRALQPRPEWEVAFC